MAVAEPALEAPAAEPGPAFGSLVDLFREADDGSPWEGWEAGGSGGGGGGGTTGPRSGADSGELVGGDDGVVDDDDDDGATWQQPRGRDGAAADLAAGHNYSEEDLNRRFKLRNGREVFEERAYLVAIKCKSGGDRRGLFSVEDSLDELSQLAETAGLLVVGSSYQKLEHPSPRTYVGAGKVSDIRAAVTSFGVETLVFDDELTAGQLRNLEEAFGADVRVCDRTALILDIFSQRAATKEATLQVELAQTEYQLPRLTRMWTHLERQAGGLSKGMGEKQIEVDKRLLRNRISALKRELEAVREHRQQYRDRRAEVPIPVISLVGYTNAGKSTLLNRITNAGVLAEDKLFATLDPTTRRVELPNGKECLFTDTVGFIQKLPTKLVAAFRATLEEISEASLLIHVVDVSHPMVEQQIAAVDKVLEELEVIDIPILHVWNKIDKAENSRALKRAALRRGSTVCISALTGEGMDTFYNEVQEMIKDLLVSIEAVVPYSQGDMLNVIHRLGTVEIEEYLPEGTLVQAHVPLSLARRLLPLRTSAPADLVVPTQSVYDASEAAYLQKL
eukprot:SM000089S23853  [mRNA]  locus=s89:564806:569291:+ [translate_table: standard]